MVVPKVVEPQFCHWQMYFFITKTTKINEPPLNWYVWYIYIYMIYIYIWYIWYMIHIYVYIYMWYIYIWLSGDCKTVCTCGIQPFLSSRRWGRGSLWNIAPAQLQATGFNYVRPAQNIFSIVSWIISGCYSILTHTHLGMGVNPLSKVWVNPF